MEKLFLTICRTLVYADIFDYPLKEPEIFSYSISRNALSLSSFGLSLRKAVGHKQVFSKGGYYYLPGREMIVAIRQRRKIASGNKMKIAQRIAFWLKFIPTVKMVAITGALAMDNSEKDDDIDLLIVTAKKRLWLTRFLTTFLVELVAERRRPKDQDFKDKICLNMFLDEENFPVPQSERNLFSAHEVCQLKPIWNRGGTYKRFIRENKWTTQFLANWRP